MSELHSNFESVGRPDMPAGYGIAPAEAGKLLPWGWAEERLSASRNYWICSTRPDGRPHVAPVWGVWFDHAFYFGTDVDSAKAKNLSTNPAVIVHLESGDEVVIIEGRAEFISLTPNLIPPLDESYLAKYELKFSEVIGEAPVLRIRPHTVLAWLETDFPNTATRWRFAE